MNQELKVLHKQGRGQSGVYLSCKNITKSGLVGGIHKNTPVSLLFLSRHSHLVIHVRLKKLEMAKIIKS